MSTYTANFTVFVNELNLALEIIPDREKLSIGLMTVNANTNVPYSDKELEERFVQLKKNNVRNIAIWDMPIEPNFWGFIKDFVLN